MQEQREARRPFLAILSYHKVGDPPPGSWEPWYYVPAGLLADQLAALREGGWEFVDLATALDGLSNPDALPERSVLVTFDDAYRSVLDLGLPVLGQLGAPGVVFVPAGLVGSMNSFDKGISEPLEPLCTWDELRDLEAGGISVQSHGVEHVSLSKLEGDALDAELSESKRRLEDALEKTIEMFAFPYGDGGADPVAVTDGLRRCDYRAACLYGGGPVELPAADPYRLSRLAVGLDSDVAAEVAASC
jgi:peptidoglycan/xylan/chitin deacetylase (PgdA/CDA1 family)